MALVALQAFESSALRTEAAPAVRVQKRDGALVAFDRMRIYAALEKAFRADLELPPEEPLDDFSLREIEEISAEAERKIEEKKRGQGRIHLEEIQDLVEILLMQHAHYTVAKLYILYRDKRAQARASEQSL
jgi:ribonucleoside-diphosphate reductase alpha chain